MLNRTSKNNNNHIIVIGAGAAGLMAAATASEMGARVSVFEKNEKAGKKIYITGKGRCNLTNSCPPELFFDNIIRNPEFMYSGFYSFTNEDVMAFMEANGTRVKTERGGRVFPVSDHASDVTRALMKPCERNDVKFKFNTTVARLLIREDESGKYVAGVELKDGTKVEAGAVILACGGATYPASGGTRLGYSIAGKCGIGVTPVRPALVPFLLKEDYIKSLMGLSLKNVCLSLKAGGKVCFEEFGEMIFTHFGISGPLVLTASSKVGDLLLSHGSLEMFIDLKPAIETDELDERLVREIREKGKRQFSSFFEGIVPKSLQPVMVELSKIDSEKRVNSITKEERKRVLSLLKAFPGTVTGLRGFEEAIITRGGIDVKEVDPSTMEAKKIKGLYICGEVMDVDALTGGFNLQCAFSMGHLAGESAAEAVLN